MRLLRGTRPLKRWRYVGVFGEELLACAARVQVGAARQTFWAVYLRGEGVLRERTRTLRARGVVELAPGVMRVTDAGVDLELTLEEGQGWEARCESPGGGEVWTRKQAGIAARGTLRLDGGPRIPVSARGDRRHGGLPRSPHRVALERGRGARTQRFGAGVERRRGRQRPCHRVRARGLDRWRRARGRAGPLQQRHGQN
jgi:hypothetical protein